MEGHRYRDLVDAERKRRAADLIKSDIKPDGNDLAEACGYLSKSHAYRAFKIWFGISFYHASRLGLSA